MDMVLKYQEKDVRTVEREDGIWFVLADVCAVLGIKNPSDVATQLPEDEKGIGKSYTNDERSKSDLGRGNSNQDMLIVSESGLYRIILRSNKPEAELFVRWVTHDVLPSIRKHGFYVDDSWKMSTQELCDMFLMPQKKMMEIIGSVLPKYWYHCNSIDRKKPLELNAMEAFLVILKASKNGVHLYEMSIPEPVKKIAQGMGLQLGLDYNKYLREKSILPRKK